MRRLRTVAAMAAGLLLAGCTSTARPAARSSATTQVRPMGGQVVAHVSSTPSLDPARGTDWNPQSAPVVASDAGRGAVSPTSAAATEANAVCTFDWRQSLAERVAVAKKFATSAYARQITPSVVGAANWAGTQADRESGACSAIRTTVMVGAPNTSTVRFIRVTATQTVTGAGKPASRQPFAVAFRVEQQLDGRWLVASLSEGG